LQQARKDTTTTTANETFEDDTKQHDTNNDTSPAAESPEVALQPMATPAAAAPASDEGQGLQDATILIQATATSAAPVLLLLLVTRRPAGAKAASKPLADYSLLAPPQMTQIELEWVKKDKLQIDALKACRLQVESCRWYQQAFN
jgi:hypothetical protein